MQDINIPINLNENSNESESANKNEKYHQITLIELYPEEFK